MRIILRNKKQEHVYPDDIDTSNVLVTAFNKDGKVVGHVSEISHGWFLYIRSNADITPHEYESLEALMEAHPSYTFETNE
mgnify:CR=1 FL=1